MKKLAEYDAGELASLSADELRELITKNLPQVNRRISMLRDAAASAYRREGTRDNVYQAALDYQRKVAFAFGNGASPDYGTKTAERYATPAAGASRQKLLAQANAMRVGLQAKTGTVTGIRAAEKKRKNTFEERYGLRKGALTYAKYREIMQALSKVEQEKIDSSTFLRIAFGDAAGKKKNFKSADDILDYIKETEQRPTGAMPADMAYQQAGAGVVWDANRKEWVRK